MIYKSFDELVKDCKEFDINKLSKEERKELENIANLIGYCYYKGQLRDKLDIYKELRKKTGK